MVETVITLDYHYTSISVMSGRVSSWQVVRTWALLVTVPLYFGSAVLWIREEVKESLAIESDSTPVVQNKIKPQDAWRLTESRAPVTVLP